jgi:RNA polymerase sigma factor (sigma-70 family)
MLRRIEEISGRVEKDVEKVEVVSVEERSPAPDEIFAVRRAALVHIYTTLPPYGSAEFWTWIEGCQQTEPLPLEVLVKVLREAVAREDGLAQRRLFVVIIARLQTSNDHWVSRALASTRLPVSERLTLAADLAADLCELLLRFLKDPRQHFWEENFLHSLRFARKHVYESFMRREGHWHKLTPGPGYRVPHALVESLDSGEWRDEFEGRRDVEDERAGQAFEAVEQADVAALLVRLPLRLRTVVWLTFWGDYTTKAIGQLWGVSDRTVRNRLQVALAQLREFLSTEREAFDGEHV